tara:strand:+ start:22 stop:159 length:138 start_codon:yes stop_codon:yes gene_type:complete
MHFLQAFTFYAESLREKTGDSGSSLVILLRIKELNLQSHKNVPKN